MLRYHLLNINKTVNRQNKSVFQIYLYLDTFGKFNIKVHIENFVKTEK